MEGHYCPLFDKEEHKAVVFVAFDRHTVEFVLEVVGVGLSGGARDAQVFYLDVLHGLDDPLAHGVGQRVVEEVHHVPCVLGFDRHVLYAID